MIFGVLRHQGGRIAEENRIRSPVSGSVRLSLTRGAVTSTAPALVSTSRGWWEPLRTTSRRPSLVALAAEPGDVGVDLGLQRLGQHPASALPHDLIDQRRPAAGRVIAVGHLRNYGEHGCTFPTGVGASVLLETSQIIGKVRPLPIRSTGFKHCSHGQLDPGRHGRCSARCLRDRSAAGRSASCIAHESEAR